MDAGVLCRFLKQCVSLCAPRSSTGAFFHLPNLAFTIQSAEILNIIFKSNIIRLHILTEYLISRSLYF